MLAFMKSFLTEEKGQGMAEYGLILALVALVVAAGLSGLATKLLALFTGVGNELVVPE